MPVVYQSWGIQKSNYKCYIWTVSFHHEQHPCAFSNVKFDLKMFLSQILHFYDLFSLWTAALCFFKNWITNVTLVRFLSFMSNNLMLFQIWNLITNVLVKNFTFYDCFPLWTVALCFFKNWITNFTLVQFPSFTNSTLVLPQIFLL